VCSSIARLIQSESSTTADQPSRVFHQDDDCLQQPGYQQKLTLVNMSTCTLQPKPFTLHPVPYTLHPAPCTPQPAPCTLHPSPYNPHPPPSTLHPPPSTLCPTRYTLDPTPNPKADSDREPPARHAPPAIAARAQGYLTHKKQPPPLGPP